VKITSASGTSAVEMDRNPAELISVFPNPFTNYVNISFPEPGRYDISIIDITGSEVYRKMIDATMNSVNTIPLAGLSPGVYIFRTGNPNSKPVRIVKN
jgi:hypothetical protein